MSALLFVYNADRGLFHTVADIAHKFLSPGTYPCNLCALTHGPVGMRTAWKSFLSALPMTLEFLHRDEFRRRFGMNDLALPAILRRGADGQVEPLIDAAQINAVKTLDELMDLVRRRAV